jgi:hypothetical protein
MTKRVDVQRQIHISTGYRPHHSALISLIVYKVMKLRNSKIQKQITYYIIFINKMSRLNKYSEKLSLTF